LAMSIGITASNGNIDRVSMIGNNDSFRRHAPSNECEWQPLRM